MRLLNPNTVIYAIDLTYERKSIDIFKICRESTTVHPDDRMC